MPGPLNECLEKNYFREVPPTCSYEDGSHWRGSCPVYRAPLSTTGLTKARGRRAGGLMLAAMFWGMTWERQRRKDMGQRRGQGGTRDLVQPNWWGCPCELAVAAVAAKQHESFAFPVAVCPKD